MARETHGHRKTDHYKRSPNVAAAVADLAWKHEYSREVSKARKEATPMQMKYYEHLCTLAQENGVKNFSGKKPKNRQDAFGLINTLIKRLTELGVDVSIPYKPKFKFDAKGNVVEIATGKIVRKRG